MKRFRILACILSVLMVFTAIVPITAATTFTAEYDLAKGAVEVTSSGTYRIYTTETTANTVKVTDADATLLLDNVAMSIATTGIAIEGDSEVTVILRGANSIKYSNATAAGAAIAVSATSKLIIEAENGTDSLDALGGRFSATIGTLDANKTTTAQIVINSGVINAAAGGNTSGSESAAIGGGRNSGAQVTINGGTVNATGLRNGPAIGAGREAPAGTSVTINGGVVTAVGGANSNGIGAGFKTKADVTVNGGVVNATTPASTITGIGTWGIDYLKTEGNVAGVLTVNGGSIYSYSTGKRAEDILTVEGKKPVKISVPEGAKAPYTVTVDGKALTFDALNTDGKLTVYAADRDVAQVGWQLGVAADGATANDIRFIGALKNKDAYASVGYTIAISGDATKTFKGTSTKIYSSMLGTDAKGQTFTAVTAAEKGADGLFAATIRNLPLTGKYTLTVSALAVDANGYTYMAVNQYTVTDGAVAQIA